MNMSELKYDIDSEHMVCNKCGAISDTEIENKIHYHIQHKTNYTMKLRANPNIRKFLLDV
jgi:Fe2+ or Zn2+ uptake regulation protein